MKRAAESGLFLKPNLPLAQKGPQQKFFDSRADITIYGGAAGGGKSWALLVDPLRHVENGNFGATLFRRTYSQVSNEGSMWDEAVKLYTHFGAIPNLGSMSWRFPSGASIGFGHFQHERDIANWRSAQIAMIGIDQLEQFTEYQFWGLLERNRSTCGVTPYLKASCNPKPGWLSDFIGWWIDQDSGYPIASRAGQTRYFARVEDQVIWGNSREEVVSMEPDAIPLSICFIPSKVTDNEVLMKKNPKYLSILMALPRVERLRQLGGNWLVNEADGIFETGTIRLVDDVPRQSARVRYWDKAGTQDGGDFSAGVLMTKDTTGLYYIEDVVHGRWSPHARNQTIKQTAELDRLHYGRVVTWIEQEPGSGGKESADISVRELAGFEVHIDKVTGDKISRANPLAAQIEAGNVMCKKADWTKGLLDELASFPGGSHDDRVDATAGAFAKLAPMPVGRDAKINVPKGTSIIDRFPKGTF